MAKYKTVKWFKEGDRIPINAKLIETKTKLEQTQPSAGGFETKEISYFLYEVEIED